MALHLTASVLTPSESHRPTAVSTVRVHMRQPVFEGVPDKSIRKGLTEPSVHWCAGLARPACTQMAGAWRSPLLSARGHQHRAFTSLHQGRGRCFTDRTLAVVTSAQQKHQAPQPPRPATRLLATQAHLRLAAATATAQVDILMHSYSTLSCAFKTAACLDL